MRREFNKRFVACGLSMVMALSLSACSENNDSEETKATEKSETAAAATTTSSDTAQETTAEKPVQTEPLVVYLNDFDGVIVDMFKNATGYDVEVVAGNGAETMSRIEAEKGNPQWDVVWIDSMSDVYALSDDDSLVTDWEPENAANLTEFSQTLVPDNKCFYPTDIHAAGVIVYRTDEFDETTAPQTFEDLTKSDYSGKIGMADPGVAAPAYPLASYFMYDLGMDEGQEYFSTLFDQGLKVYPKNPQVVEALASGEISIAMLQETNAYDMVSSGEPVDIIWPEDGAPGSTRVAAISADSDQIEIAKIFVNFLLDASTQQQLVDTGDEGYFEPSVNDVNMKAEREADAKLVVAEAKWSAENEAEIKNWFADMSAQ